MTAAGAVVWTVLALGFPQAPPGPPSTQRQPPPATGLIVGRVVDGSTGRPVAGAIVTMDGALGRQPRAMANASGQFVFRKLTQGTYSLSASRAGYVTGAFGRRRPGGMSLPLRLTEGERIGDVVIPIWKHATISGRVTDEAGEPLIGVQVRAFERRIVAGRRRIAQGPLATTDDRGIYRMTGLSPGEYLVAFVWRESAVPAAVAEIVRMPSNNDTKAQEIIRERLNMGSGFSSAAGVPVGGLVRDIMPMGAPVPPSADESAVFIYPTQFYPGVPSAARAAAITLASGQEREAIDFTLAPVKTAKVSGTLIGPEGPVPYTALRLISATDEALTDLETSATMTGAGGDFTLLGVPPGQYTLKVLRVPRQPLPTPAAPTSMTQIQLGSSTIMTSSSGPPNPSQIPPPVPDDPTMFAETPVSVGNRDVSDVVVMVQRGARVTGRFEFDGTRERPDASALMRIPVVVERADAGSPGTRGDMIPAGRADETGAFKTYGVAAGKYLIRINGAPGGWTLRSVMADGRDVSETPLDLRTTDVANVVVTFTDRPTKLTGVARTSAGNGDPDAGVVVFPVDAGAWSDYGLNPRRVRSTHAGRDGSYTFTGLPAGDYYVAAIHEDTTPEWRDPRVLEDLARSASQVRLTEGDTRTQDLKIVKGGSQ